MRIGPVLIAAFLSGGALLFAKAGTGTDNLTDEAKELLRASLKSGHFRSGTVEEILLSEPETEAENLLFVTEFTVRTANRVIRCEDWKLALKKAAAGYTVMGLERGRCND